jgi:hypothetical protein
MAKPDGELELTATVVEDALPAPEPEEKPLAEAQAGELSKVFRARAKDARSVKSAVVHGAVWAGMAACVALLVAAAGFFRMDVVRLVPRASGAYAMVGMPVNPVGLEFEKVSARAALQDGHDALVVSGVIRNVQDRALAAPPLKISVLDKAGKAVAHKIAAVDEGRIAPGQARHFVIAVLDPPASADDVEVAFAALRAPKAKPAAHAAHSQTTLRGPQRSLDDEAIEATPLAADSPYALSGHDDHG